MRSFLARYARCAARQLRRLRADTSGNVAVILAVMGAALMVAIGAAVDMGRWLNARDQTVTAIDAAVLAGGRHLQLNASDKDGAIAAAKKYYANNIITRLPVINDSVDFQVSADGMGITANGTAYIRTPFLRFANLSELPLISTSQTQFAESRITVGGNGGENVELSLMLDVTGSMCSPCTKLQAMKDAAKDLIDIVVWKDQSKFTSKVALVPFAEDVRLPAGALAKARGTVAAKTVSGKTYYPSDCVVERVGGQKYTDAQPKSGQYVQAHYTEESTGAGSSRKGVCKVPASAEIVPLSSDANMLKAKVDALTADAATAGHLGTAWAWYMLSPSWASLWPAANRPVAYGTEDTRKIAVLMTDGAYNSQYDSNGLLVNFDPIVSTNCPQATNGCSSPQAKSLCDNMKAKGITVYTVGFAINNATAKDVLTKCATDPAKYYNAESEEQLKHAFRDIALKLSSLYISK